MQSIIKLKCVEKSVDFGQNSGGRCCLGLHYACTVPDLTSIKRIVAQALNHISALKMNTPPDRPSEQALLQGVRNRLIDYLEVAASFEAQMTFSEQSPQVNVALEVLEQWADWVGPDWQDDFVSPVFSSDELLAIGLFQDVWLGCRGRLLQEFAELPVLTELFEHSDWRSLRVGAEMLLVFMMKRGRLSECEEI